MFGVQMRMGVRRTVRMAMFVFVLHVLVRVGMGDPVGMPMVVRVSLVLPIHVSVFSVDKLNACRAVIGA